MIAVIFEAFPAEGNGGSILILQLSYFQNYITFLVSFPLKDFKVLKTRASYCPYLSGRTNKVLLNGEMWIYTGLHRQQEGARLLRIIVSG
jgi:hypothetical protein